jgi:hypothetical protein
MALRAQRNAVKPPISKTSLWPFTSTSQSEKRGSGGLSCGLEKSTNSEAAHRLISQDDPVSGQLSSFPKAVRQ